MKMWLLTGGGGMVATDLRHALEHRGEEVVVKPRAELDVTNERLVQKVVEDVRPDVIVNCAAWTRVDAAESEESTAAAINGGAVELLAVSANSVGARLVQISTDFVFDGSKREPYEPVPSFVGKSPRHTRNGT
jgi:dTDP-4-dehydrorhamnose reductase